MHTYGRIGGFRLLDIKVVFNDNDILYEGRSDDAPNEIKQLRYSKVEMQNPIILYVYN